MGHVINPVSYRLYNVRYWNNVWFLNNSFNYSYILNQDNFISLFCKKFLFKLMKLTKVGVVFVNSKVLRCSDKFSLYIYIHDSLFDSLFLTLRKNNFFKRLKKLFYSRRFFFYNKDKVKSLKKQFRKIKLKYFKKLFFIFLKNKIIKKYWFSIKIFLIMFLEKIIPKRFYVKYDIKILSISKSNVNSNVIAEFFFVRLSQYYTIWEVLKNVNYLFKKLMKKSLVKGYKITCSGRFSRKQRATYSWKSFGTISPSSMKSRLDYTHRSIALRYSSCTIKVWVRLSNKNKKLVDFSV